MTGAYLLSNLLAYSAQAACLIALAALAARVLPVGSAPLRYAWWRAVLLASLALPFVPGRQPAETTTGLVAFDTSAPVLAGVAAAGAPLAPAVSWPAIVGIVLAGGVVLRAVWLAVGLARLRSLRRSGQIATDAPLIDQARTAVAARAEIRWVPDLAHPVTFGARRPVVLLPDLLRTRPAAIQRAVLCHELLHVRRRDWLWLLAEEGVRAVLWFHPAVWWLISRVQLAREEAVDELAVRASGARRAYVEALMIFADGATPATAAPFAFRRHLFRRILLICKEEPMSSRRIVLSGIAATAIVAAGAWFAMGAFPLAQEEPSAPGTLEAQANPITPENPIPRRLYAPTPPYPGEATGSGIGGTVNLRVALDAFGRIGELRRQQVRLTNPTNLEEVSWLAMVDTFATSAEATVRQWTYDPPAEPPIAFDVVVTFAPEGEVAASQRVPPGREDRNGPTRQELEADVAANRARLEAEFEATDPSNGVLRVGENLPPPRKVSDVPPVYPEAAQDARVGGVVILEIVIDETGAVREARVTRSVPVLDQAAVDAVMQWEYEPTLLNGVPVSVMMYVTVNFTLS